MRYKGFIVTLSHVQGGWIYALTRESTSMDYGSNGDPVPYNEAIKDAKSAINDLIAEIKEYQILQSEESGY